MARFAHQPDLFAAEPDPDNPAASLDEPPDEAWIQRIRDELNATVALAQHSTKLPWGDLTKSMMAEMMFAGKLGWLPKAEADALRAALATELARLYDAEDEYWYPVLNLRRA
jgi:hypothetical protein